MKADRKGMVTVIACVMAVSVLGYFGIALQRSRLHLMSGRTLASSFISSGYNRAQRDYRLRVDMRGSVTDYPTARFLLDESSQWDKSASQLAKSLDSVSSLIRDLLLRAYADGYLLGYAYAQKESLPQQPIRTNSSDKELLLAIGGSMMMYIDDSDGYLPSALDSRSLQQVMSVYIRKEDWISPTSYQLYRWNSRLSGRRYESLKNSQSKVALYQNPPTADGMRWVLLLDLKTVKHVNASVWAKLKQTSGINDAH